eukprot:1156662-Pelagomonas_calceolata.AAC.4
MYGALSSCVLISHLAAVTDSFNDQEEMVFEQLSKLCRDSAFFKSYAVASLVVFKDTVQASIAGQVARASRHSPVEVACSFPPLDITANYVGIGGLSICVKTTASCRDISLTAQSILLALGKAKRPLPGFHEQEPADGEEHKKDRKGKGFNPLCKKKRGEQNIRGEEKREEQEWRREEKGKGK